MSRKELVEARNIGQNFANSVEPYFDGPTIAQARTSGIMVERVLYAILSQEMDRLTSAAGAADLTRIFAHVFDPLAGEAERAEYVTHLQRRQPQVVLGYPRDTTEPPVISIVLGEEEEDEQSASIGDFVGETQPGESGPYAEYLGTHFTQTFNVYVFSDHPVVVAYLYHVTKLVLFAAKMAMIKAGVVAPRLSGGELMPNEGYLPEDWFARVVRVSCKSLTSVPVLKLDPNSYRVGGIFMDDINVDGIQGGVHPTGHEESE